MSKSVSLQLDSLAILLPSTASHESGHSYLLIGSTRHGHINSRMMSRYMVTYNLCNVSNTCELQTVATNRIIIFALVGILIGFSKGGLGGPVPVALTVPMLTLIIDPQVAVALILPLLIFADVFALYIYWKQWDQRYIKLMMLPGLVGVVVGALVLKDIDAVTLKRIIGGLTLVSLAFKIASDRLAVAYVSAAKMARLFRRLGVRIRLYLGKRRRATLHRLSAAAAKNDPAEFRRRHNTLLCSHEFDQAAELYPH